MNGEPEEDHERLRSDQNRGGPRIRVRDREEERVLSAQNARAVKKDRGQVLAPQDGSDDVAGIEKEIDRNEEGARSKEPQCDEVFGREAEIREEVLSGNAHAAPAEAGGGREDDASGWVADHGEKRLREGGARKDVPGKESEKINKEKAPETTKPGRNRASQSEGCQSHRLRMSVT